jgi:hypothetical protein
MIIRIRIRIPSAGRRVAVAVLAAIGLAIDAGAVGGHGGYVDLVITPPIVEPGDEISIQGQALWTELPVDVDLVHDDGGRRRLGSGMTAPDGSLSMTVVLPDGIPDGAYQVIVTNPYGETDHGSVVVRSTYPTALVTGVIVVGVLGFVLILRLLRRRPATGRPAVVGPPPSEPGDGGSG